jgi:DNA invertase Pin-like site-specific DNA recombinase
MISKSKANPSRKLRFAALIRVSTEKQEQQGESLRIQKKQIETAVQQLGGVISKTYAGQEHATEGHEKERFKSLLADAAKTTNPFDAVIVVDASRWSRDQVESEKGLRH